MRRFTSAILTLSLIWCLASGLAQWKQSSFIPKVKAGATFTPHLLISDYSFTNNKAMSVAQIQAFLKQKKSMLTNYKKDGKSAAKIIYDAANGITSGKVWEDNDPAYFQTVRLHPGVLLVNLQKEMSLITAQFNAATFARRMRKAMGYGCPDSGGCSSKYAGFYKQVNFAAWAFSRGYDCSVNLNIPCAARKKVGTTYTFYDWNGKRTVKIGNRATASLYRYTPHVYNGNYNFWKLYRSWFGEGKYDPIYDLPTVARASVDGPIYAILDNKKYQFVDANAFNNWGLATGLIVTKTESELALMPTGNNIGDLIKGEDEIYYLVSGGKRIWVSEEMATILGWKESDFTLLPDKIVYSLAQNPKNMLNFVQTVGLPITYLLNHNILYPLTGGLSVAEYGYNANDIMVLASQVMARFSAGMGGPEAGLKRLIRENETKYYLLYKNQLRQFKKTVDIVEWGLNTAEVFTPSAEFFSSFRKGGQLTRLVRAKTGKYYWIAQGKKRPFKCWASVRHLGYNSTPVVALDGGYLDKIGKGSPLGHLIMIYGKKSRYYVNAKGIVYRIGDKVWRQMGWSKKDITKVSKSYYNSLKKGPGLVNVVREVKSNKVYVLLANKKMRVVQSKNLRHWGLHKVKIMKVDEQFLAPFEPGRKFSRLVQSSSKRIYLLGKGKKRYIGSSRAFKKRGYKYKWVIRVPDAWIRMIPGGKTIK